MAALSAAAVKVLTERKLRDSNVQSVAKQLPSVVASLPPTQIYDAILAVGLDVTDASWDYSTSFTISYFGFLWGR